MTNITLALDWTPNPIHAGFFVAQAKGWYREAGLEVTFLSPEADNYQTLPSDKVASGEVQLAICPSEFVIQNHYLGGGGKLMAVAALLQRSASAFATLQKSGIERPQQLDDRTYALMGLPFEHNVLSQVIYMDGGLGVTNNVSTAKLSTWQHLLNGTADCAWIFKPIEGIEAEHTGTQLNLFDPHAYGIPYGYAPVLVASPETVKAENTFLDGFMKATARGYHFAHENPTEAARILLADANLTQKPEESLLLKMQEATAAYYLTHEGHWGTMESDRWHGYIKWLEEQKLLVLADHLPSQEKGTLQEVLFTNRFIEPDSFTQV